MTKYFLKRFGKRLIIFLKENIKEVNESVYHANETLFIGTESDQSSAKQVVLTEIDVKNITPEKPKRNRTDSFPKFISARVQIRR